MFLDSSAFSTILETTPLVSIDLIIEDTDRKILLGKRKNRPAQGFFFVPGGRILKNESLSSAFKRLTSVELGEAFDISHATLLGPYDHFYTDSIFGQTPSTHYVAIAYRLQVEKLLSLPDAQHYEYRWFSVENLLVSPEVHKHTKAYFSYKD